MPKLALEGEVVDREQAGDVLVARPVAIFDRQIGRHQAGLPIVGVDHIDLQIQQADGFEHRAAEEHEAFAVVDVVLAIDVIKLVAVVVLILLDQIHRRIACPAWCFSANGR